MSASCAPSKARSPARSSPRRPPSRSPMSRRSASPSSPSSRRPTSTRRAVSSAALEDAGDAGGRDRGGASRRAQAARTTATRWRRIDLYRAALALEPGRFDLWTGFTDAAIRASSDDWEVQQTLHRGPHRRRDQRLSARRHRRGARLRAGADRLVARRPLRLEAGDPRLSREPRAGRGPERAARPTTT